MDSQPPFRIKICGITRSEDIDVAVDAGADAIGLNFYTGSKRYVNEAQANRLRDHAGDRIRVIGVWVNEDVDRIRAETNRLGLDAIQLHGDEPASALQALGSYPVIKALRHPFTPDAEALLSQAFAVERGLAGVLIDAAQPGQYGGTGTRVAWASLQPERQRIPPGAMLLAGGLTPDTVQEAVLTAIPDGVDVASGVETVPGHKDADLVRAFVAAVHEVAPWR
ncbi:MAG: phosphoribosylanthranilate isomerase [Planctomycetota bacterium]